MRWRPTQTPEENKFHVNAALVTYLLISSHFLSFTDHLLTVRKGQGLAREIKFTDH